MKMTNRFLALFLPIVCMGCHPTDMEPLILPTDLVGESCENPLMFTLKVSNQSTSLEKVDIEIWIDGTQVVNQDFEVLGQHNFYYFDFQMCPGEHTLFARSEKGSARIRRTFEFSQKTDMASIAYCYYGQEHYSPTPKQFSFEVYQHVKCEIEAEYTCNRLYADRSDFEECKKIQADRCLNARKMERESKERRIKKKLYEYGE